MEDKRTRFWYPVANPSSYGPRSIVWIEGRGYHEVLVCGVREILVRRLTVEEVVRRHWWGRARRWWKSKWPFGRR